MCARVHMCCAYVCACIACVRACMCVHGCMLAFVHACVICMSQISCPLCSAFCWSLIWFYLLVMYTDCSPACANGGTCNSLSVCDCTSDYYGSYCQHRKGELHAGCSYSVCVYAPVNRLLNFERYVHWVPPWLNTLRKLFTNLSLL